MFGAAMMVSIVALMLHDFGYDILYITILHCTTSHCVVLCNISISHCIKLDDIVFVVVYVLHYAMFCIVLYVISCSIVQIVRYNNTFE